MNQELEFAREIQQSALPLAEHVMAKRHEYGILGGLGIYMVRKMMDYIDYKFEDDRNVFTVGKNVRKGEKQQ